MTDKPDDIGVAVTYSPAKERFLVLKRREDQDGSFPGCWEFAGGYVEENEEAVDTALRELREETGFVGEVIREGESFEVDTGENYYRIHPVLVVVDGERPELTDEHAEYRWVMAEETDEMNTVGKFRKDLENVGVLDE